MAAPIVLIDRVSVGANAEVNLVEGRKGTTLTGRSQVVFYLNRGTTAITFTAFVGSQGIMERAGAAVDVTAGQTPSFQDDKVVTTFGMPGDLIVLNAANSSGAPVEAGFIVQITEIDDAVLQQAMEQAALSGIVLG